MIATASTDNLQSEGVVSVSQAATFLSMSRVTVYKLMDNGTLPFIRIGSTRRIRKRDLLALVEKGGSTDMQA